MCVCVGVPSRDLQDLQVEIVYYLGGRYVQEFFEISHQLLVFFRSACVSAWLGCLFILWVLFMVKMFHRKQESRLVVAREGGIRGARDHFAAGVQASMIRILLSPSLLHFPALSHAAPVSQRVLST